MNSYLAEATTCRLIIKYLCNASLLQNSLLAFAYNRTPNVSAHIICQHLEVICQVDEQRDWLWNTRCDSMAICYSMQAELIRKKRTSGFVPNVTMHIYGRTGVAPCISTIHHLSSKTTTLSLWQLCVTKWSNRPICLWLEWNFLVVLTVT